MNIHKVNIEVKKQNNNKKNSSNKKIPKIKYSKEELNDLVYILCDAIKNNKDIYINNLSNTNVDIIIIPSNNSSLETLTPFTFNIKLKKINN